MSDASLVNFEVPTSSAVTRSVATKLIELCVSVTDFGAVPNRGGPSTGDQAPAINAAIDWYRSYDPTGAFGMRLQFPPGNYQCSTPIRLHRAVVFEGDGINMSGIVASPRAVWNTPLLLVDQAAIHFQNMQFGFDQMRTGSQPSIAVRSGGTLTMRNCAVGMGEVPAISITDGRFFGYELRGSGGAFYAVPDGTPWMETNGSASVYVTDVELFEAEGQSANIVAIRVNGGRWVQFAGRLILRGGKTLIEIVPSVPTRYISIDSARVENCSGPGILIAPTSSSPIGSIRLDNIRIENPVGDAVYIAGTGLIEDLQLSSINIDGSNVSPATQHGINYLGGISRFSILNPTITGCVDGIRIGSGTSASSGWSIQGGRVGGLIGNRPNNSGYGINILPASHNNYIIQGLDLRGNNQGPLSDGGSGNSKLISYIS